MFQLWDEYPLPSYIAGLATVAIAVYWNEPLVSPPQKAMNGKVTLTK